MMFNEFLFSYTPYGYVPFVVIIIRSYPHSGIITEFVARVTRRLPLVDQELLTLLKHQSSPSLLGFVWSTKVHPRCWGLSGTPAFTLVVGVCLEHKSSPSLLGFVWSTRVHPRCWGLSGTPEFTLVVGVCLEHQSSPSLLGFVWGTRVHPRC
jgi:hypothetical protein